MRLGDIDDQKRNFVLILIVELVEGGNLPPERRSSVAAENHDDRLCFVQFGQANGAGFVELAQREIWRWIADVDYSRACPRPHGFKWADEKYFPRQMHHHPPEFFRSAMHCAPHETYESNPEDENHNQNPRGDFFPASAALGFLRDWFRSRTHNCNPHT